MIPLDQTAIIPAVEELADAHQLNLDRWDRDEVVDHAGNRLTALTRLAWLLPALVSAIVGFIRPTWPDLSASELSLYALVRLNWHGLIALSSDLDSPFPILMWLWAHVFGTGDLALRAPSILLMAATCGLTGVLGSWLSSPKVGFTAGLLLAVLPIVTRYGQDAGPVAFSVFAAVAATLLFARFLAEPERKPVVRYGIAAAFMLMTGMATFVVLLVHLLVLIVVRRNALVLGAAFMVTASFPAIALYSLVFHQQHGATPFNAANLAFVLGGTAAVGGVVIGLAAPSFSTLAKQFLLSAWALAPVVLAVAWTARGQWESLVLLALPAWVLLGAHTLRALPLVHGVVVVCLVAGLGASAHRAFREPTGHGLSAVAVSEILNEQTREGDAIVYGPTDAEALVGRDVVARYVPVARRPLDLLMTRAPREHGNLYAAQCLEPAKCLAPATRIWVLRVGSPASPLDGFGAAEDGFLRVTFKIDRRWDLNGVSLSLLVPVEGAG